VISRGACALLRKRGAALAGLEFVALLPEVALQFTDPNIHARVVSLLATDDINGHSILLPKKAVGSSFAGGLSADASRIQNPCRRIENSRRRRLRQRIKGDS